MEMILNLFVFVLIFLFFLESIDVIDVYLCGKCAVIWIESVGDNLGNVIGVCNFVG